MTKRTTKRATSPISCQILVHAGACMDMSGWLPERYRRWFDGVVENDSDSHSEISEELEESDSVPDASLVSSTSLDVRVLLKADI